MLKPSLREDKDYLLISQELWEFFASKYQGIEIKRPIISSERVEVYL